MTPGLGILAAQWATASPALGWLAVCHGGEAIGRHQGPDPAGGALLATPGFSGGWRGRLPLRPDGVGRRRLGTVGGILVDAGLQVPGPAHLISGNSAHNLE